SPSALTATCVCDRARPRNVPARNAEQFAHAQFHCGKPPPAADPRIFTSTPRFYRAELIYVATAASAVKSRCEHRLQRDNFSDWFRLSKNGKHLPVTRHRARRFQIHAPDALFERQALKPYFAVLVGPMLPHPYNAKLRPVRPVLQIHHVAGPQFRAHAFEHGSAIAQILHARHFGKRVRLAVHAPDAYRQLRWNSRLRASIHRPSLQTARIVEHARWPRKSRQLPVSGLQSYLLELVVTTTSIEPRDYSFRTAAQLAAAHSPEASAQSSIVRGPRLRSRRIRNNKW